VLEELTARVASLILEAQELAADAEVYRLMMQVSTAEVGRLDRLTRSQSRTIQLLRSELRRYTEAQIERAA
jgi:hypothetical protein